MGKGAVREKRGACTQSRARNLVRRGEKLMGNCDGN